MSNLKSGLQKDKDNYTLNWFLQHEYFFLVSGIFSLT